MKTQNYRIRGDEAVICVFYPITICRSGCHVFEGSGGGGHRKKKK